MKRQDVTQVVLAAQIGVTQAAVSKWMNGTVPKGDQLLWLARSLGVTMEWLLTGEMPKTPVFAQWNRGFYLAYCSYADALTKESCTRDENGQIVRLADEKPTGGVAMFRFLPPDHPEAISRDEQLRFYQRYTKASDDERRQMLSLGPGSERFFSARVLGGFGMIMKRHLEETG